MTMGSARRDRPSRPAPCLRHKTSQTRVCDRPRLHQAAAQTNRTEQTLRGPDQRLYLSQGRLFGNDALYRRDAIERILRPA